MFTFRKRKNKTTPRKVDGVFFDQTRRVVAIKKRTIIVEVERTSLQFLWAGVLGVGVLTSVVFFVFGSAYRTHAETLLYPQTCLGGWNHSEKATGIPDVGSTGEYTDENSASILNTLAQIFCGGFSGDIPTNTYPTKIVVKFSWALKEFIPSPAAASIFSSEEYASSTIQIIDVPVETPAQLFIPIPVDQPSSSTPETPSSPTPLETSSDTLTPIPDAQSSSEPLSFLSWFIQPQRVFAQEIGTTSPDDMTTLSNVPPPVEPNSGVDAILEVLYTLDGAEWKTLGTATQETLSSAVFEIPLNSVSNWKDLSQLQISLHTLSGLDPSQTLYLDGMLLVTEYQDTPTEVKEKEIQAYNDAFSLYRDSLSTRDLALVVGSSTSPSLVLSKTDDGNGKQVLIVEAPPGPLIVYSNSDPTYRFVYGVGEGPVSIEAYHFLTGSYTLVLTMDPDACGSVTREECMNEPHFIAAASFSIIDLDPTILPAALAPSDATISQYPIEYE